MYDEDVDVDRGLGRSWDGVGREPRTPTTLQLDPVTGLVAKHTRGYPFRDYGYIWAEIYHMGKGNANDAHTDGDCPKRVLDQKPSLYTPRLHMLTGSNQCGEIRMLDNASILN